MEEDVESAEVKRLVTQGLPDWIEEEPELRRRLREMMGGTSRRSSEKMTYEEFLAWADLAD